MRRRKLLIATLCAICAFGIWYWLPRQAPTNELPENLVDPGTIELSAEEESICEAVFRFQFQHNASGQQSEAPAYFLSIMGKKPTFDFLRHFAGHTPPVMIGSAFGVGKGVLFRISAIALIDSDMAEVHGGYYEGCLSASGDFYHLIRVGDQWTVEYHKMIWIS